MYDLIILGGGPAGAGAAVYSARKLLKTAIITKEFGGQSTVSETIYNWIGTKEISGNDLAKNLEDHVKNYSGQFLDIFEGEEVEKIEKENDYFVVKTKRQKEFKTKSVIVATGSSRRKLTIEGSLAFENKGITYCATCDGPLFSEMDVAVVGGGNAGFETAMQLLAYCKSVTLLESGDCMKADKITIEKVMAYPNFRCFKNIELVKVEGNKFVESLTYKDKETKEEKTIQVSGIFVEIGQTPNTLFIKDLVKINDYGKIVVDPVTQRTSVDGIWAAGDCTDGKYNQNNIAVGDAVKALEDAYIWLKTKEEDTSK
ncbi:MAG TPA: FAD-dependent oxidoreductase [Candidatus Paceibacterota bacterium]|jgi:alkyl hydroperoxide reductase subunit F|nr:FAD-dependent oxidoreductase [Candidatus Paceibacterota bacterium]HQC45939.1 FAD-dependent oxidoreductase [Candidatus Paceibacterota bacterium]HQM18738.1 FAD-dependent oxidoreductase [Candidatus Paceibacterota bacterium]